MSVREPPSGLGYRNSGQWQLPTRRQRARRILKQEKACQGTSTQYTSSHNPWLGNARRDAQPSKINTEHPSSVDTGRDPGGAGVRRPFTQSRRRLPHQTSRLMIFQVN